MARELKLNYFEIIIVPELIFSINMTCGHVAECDAKLDLMCNRCRNEVMQGIPIFRKYVIVFFTTCVPVFFGQQT